MKTMDKGIISHLFTFTGSTIAALVLVLIVVGLATAFSTGMFGEGKMWDEMVGNFNKVFEPFGGENSYELPTDYEIKENFILKYMEGKDERIVKKDDVDYYLNKSSIDNLMNLLKYCYKRGEFKRQYGPDQGEFKLFDETCGTFCSNVTTERNCIYNYITERFKTETGIDPDLRITQNEEIYQYLLNLDKNRLYVIRSHVRRKDETMVKPIRDLKPSELKTKLEIMGSKKVESCQNWLDKQKNNNK
ncbi:MAG: hypothetical protein ABEK36_03085 [Candidatus Aenigmatarchaeota archaeon]